MKCPKCEKQVKNTGRAFEVNYRMAIFNIHFARCFGANVRPCVHLPVCDNLEQCFKQEQEQNPGGSNFY